jgi:hypothetical protein
VTHRGNVGIVIKSRKWALFIGCHSVSYNVSAGFSAVALQSLAINPHRGGSILHEKIKPFENYNAIFSGFSRLPRPTSVTAKTQKISMRIFLVEG